MKTLTLYSLLLLSVVSCKAQEKVTARYIGHRYKESKNKSFINNQLLFLNGNDTVQMNLRVPFDMSKPEIIDRGIYYNCHLKSDTVYTIKLKKICVSDMPDVPNNYYKINTIPDKKDCSKFTEVEKNTGYKYEGNYGKYVDVKNVLYEIIGLSPSGDCIFQN